VDLVHDHTPGIVKRMKFSHFAACLCAVAACATLHGSILPTFHLDPLALQVFEKYVAQFEKNVADPYAQSGKMWIDESSCCMRKGAFASGKPVVEPRENEEIVGGSIHHFTAAMHLTGTTIADVRHVMQDYANYPKYFKPDVGKGAGVKNPDSTATDEHYTSQLSLIQTTFWMSVSYDCVYETHYRLLDPHRWESVSHAASIKEWQNPKDASQGYLPEGEDHGFLWRTNTFWFVRENNDGVDIELDSMTLSRPVPTGFGWWGTKRTRDAVEKMIKDLKAAVDSNRPPQVQHS
jgi:hypothetical protein